MLLEIRNFEVVTFNSRVLDGERSFILTNAHIYYLVLVNKSSLALSRSGGS